MRYGDARSDEYVAWRANADKCPKPLALTVACWRPVSKYLLDPLPFNPPLAPDSSPQGLSIESRQLLEEAGIGLGRGMGGVMEAQELVDPPQPVRSGLESTWGDP
jgi:hypothetical protein